MSTFKAVTEVQGTLHKECAPRLSDRECEKKDEQEKRIRKREREKKKKFLRKIEMLINWIYDSQQIYFK